MVRDILSRPDVFHHELLGPVPVLRLGLGPRDSRNQKERDEENACPT